MSLRWAKVAYDIDVGAIDKIKADLLKDFKAVKDTPNCDYNAAGMFVANSNSGNTYTFIHYNTHENILVLDYSHIKNSKCRLNEVNMIDKIIKKYKPK